MDEETIKIETEEERLERMIKEDLEKMEENENQESAVFSQEDELSWVRSLRNQKLKESDWTQLPDVPESIKSLWKAYRQELRDITVNFTDAQSITWPTQPN